jgi:hypothetical protein
LGLINLYDEVVRFDQGSLPKTEVDFNERQSPFCLEATRIDLNAKTIAGFQGTTIDARIIIATVTFGASQADRATSIQNASSSKEAEINSSLIFLQVTD